MVCVRVRFYASLRDEIGAEEVVMYLSDSSFYSLLSRLKALFDGRADRLFSEDGKLRDGLIVSVNNSIVHLSNVRELKLCENDIVDFMPAPSGG
ncbi:MAG: MoaD/ThiS family protein [Candidatus Bathyarchaeia archaeon]